MIALLHNEYLSHARSVNNRRGGENGGGVGEKEALQTGLGIQDIKFVYILRGSGGTDSYS